MGPAARTWVLGVRGSGAGRRWYKVRLRPTYGLMDGIAFPCFVDPSDPKRLWIDWDAAYEATSIDGAATPASSASWPGARTCGSTPSSA